MKSKLVRLVILAAIAASAALLALGSSEASIWAGPNPDPGSFVSSVSSLAQAEMCDSGVPASFSIAQASLESDWNSLRSLAATYGNYHGIKCSSPSEGLDCVELSGDRWNRYSSASNGFLWHGRWLHGNPRYANAFNFMHDPEEFARQIAKAGYCPPPDCITEQYAQIVNGRIDKWDMRQYDNQETPFVGVYYHNPNLSGQPAFSGVSGRIDFNWGDRGPSNSYRPSYNVGVDDFSVRWMAKQQFSDGRYRFHTAADDGVKLWIDDNLIIDQWRDQALTDCGADIELTGGFHWLRMEYYERTEAAVVKLWWEPIGEHDGDLGDRLGRLWDEFLADIQARFEQELERAERRLLEWLEARLEEFADQLYGQVCATIVLPVGTVLLWRARCRRRK